ncbi:hypothetical protein AVEN_125043-1 [Araneus ventricosus]|uniref:Uncharacterized protein n=1 Tax=Araneus ventricosus TaxID=182803 RepID=A0A4Y2TWF3_ARAVE|nr:hypothetical protein AVEN_125043-1 [Araneus ventricosus]
MKASNNTITRSPGLLFLKREIRSRIDLLLPELKSRVQDRIRKGVFEFRDRKFDIGDKVAVRVQGTLVRQHEDQIDQWRIKCKRVISFRTQIPLHRRFAATHVRESNQIFSMLRQLRIFLHKYRRKNRVPLPHQQCHQLMNRLRSHHR